MSTVEEELAVARAKIARLRGVIRGAAEKLTTGLSSPSSWAILIETIAEVVRVLAAEAEPPEVVVEPAPLHFVSRRSEWETACGKLVPAVPRATNDPDRFKQAGSETCPGCRPAVFPGGHVFVGGGICPCGQRTIDDPARCPLVPEEPPAVPEEPLCPDCGQRLVDHRADRPGEHFMVPGYRDMGEGDPPTEEDLRELFV